MPVCQSAPGDIFGHQWSWRTIDGRKCWYEGKHMLPKTELGWPLPQVELPVVEQPVIEHPPIRVVDVDELLATSYWPIHQPDLDLFQAFNFEERFGSGWVVADVKQEPAIDPLPIAAAVLGTLLLLGMIRRRVH